MAAAGTLATPALWSGGAAAGARPNPSAELVPGTGAVAGTGAGASPTARAQLSFRYELA